MITISFSVFLFLHVLACLLIFVGNSASDI